MLIPVPPSECVRAREAASRRLDGELPELDAIRLDSHLRRCAACRELAAGMAATTAELRRAPLVDPRLTIRIPAHRFSYRRIGAASTAAATAAAAAVAVVALSVGTTSFNRAQHALSDSAIYQQLTLKEEQMSEVSGDASTPGGRPLTAPTGLDPSAGF